MSGSIHLAPTKEPISPSPLFVLQEVSAEKPFSAAENNRSRRSKTCRRGASERSPDFEHFYLLPRNKATAVGFVGSRVEQMTRGVDRTAPGGWLLLRGSNFGVHRFYRRLILILVGAFALQNRRLFAGDFIAAVNFCGVSYVCLIFRPVINLLTRACWLPVPWVTAGFVQNYLEHIDNLSK